MSRKWDALIESYLNHRPRMAEHEPECFDPDLVERRGTDAHGVPLPCCELDVVNRELARLFKLQRETT